MRLATFDPWRSVSRTGGRAYRAYCAYPEADLGTLGTIGTQPVGEIVAISAQSRRQQWLARLASCRPMSPWARRSIAVAQRLTSSPWADRLIEFGWTDQEIFGVDGKDGNGLIVDLSAHGSCLRAVTEAASWIELSNGHRHRHRRGAVGSRARLIWNISMKGGIDHGH